jgi:hypothetical protein
MKCSNCLQDVRLEGERSERSARTLHMFARGADTGTDREFCSAPLRIGWACGCGGKGVRSLESDGQRAPEMLRSTPSPRKNLMQIRRAVAVLVPVAFLLAACADTPTAPEAFAPQVPSFDAASSTSDDGDGGEATPTSGGGDGATVTTSDADGERGIFTAGSGN